MVEFSIKAKSENVTKVVAETPGGFKITVDEPEKLGGTNEGPSPVEYVLAAFAGCLNVVGNMVAKEMGFKINSLSFQVRGELDPAKFMGKSEEPRAGYQEISVEIDLDSDADAETLNKWLEVVESRCPVSDNLANKTPINLEIK
jgi:uncharacterized OsmC-like protein